MKRSFLSNAFYAAVGCILLTSLFSACTKTSNNSNTQQVSGIMAFNLVPDKSTGLVLALSNNSLTQSPLLFSGYTGNYLSIYSGSNSVQAYDYISNVVLTNTNYTFANNKYYSFFAVGANSVYSNVVVLDNFDSLSSTNGQAYVRYINAIPDSTNQTVTIGANGTNAVNESAHYKSVSQFVPVAPGQVVVNITNGSNISSNRTITLEQKKAYTVLLAGMPGSTDSTMAVQIRFITNGTLGK